MNLRLILSFGLITATLSCQQNKFKGSTPLKVAPGKEDAPLEPEDEVQPDPEPPADDTVSGDTKSLPSETIDIATSSSKLSLNFNASSSSLVKGTNGMVPLSLYFVVDNSGSMQANIDAVRSSIAALVKDLNSKGFEMKIGLISFKDDVKTLMSLTDDIPKFETILGTLVAGGGGDTGEASLLATKTAIENMQKEAKVDSLKTLFVFSDASGHMGGLNAASHNCDPIQLINFLNSLSPQQQALTKIYYSAGSVPIKAIGEPCLPFPAAKPQWDQILQSSLTTVDVSKRGGALSYPVVPNVITKELGELVVTTTADINTLCLATEANLMSGASILASWKASSVKDVYNLSQTGNNVLWQTGLNSKMDAKIKANATLELTQCCLLNEDAVAGKFDACTKAKSKVTFQTGSYK